MFFIFVPMFFDCAIFLNYARFYDECLHWFIRKCPFLSAMRMLGSNSRNTTVRNRTASILSAHESLLWRVISLNCVELLECRAGLGRRTAGQSRCQLFRRIARGMTGRPLRNGLLQLMIVHLSSITGTWPTESWHSEVSWFCSNREVKWVKVFGHG